MQHENENREMVYRGREDRVHIADGKRAEMGDGMATWLDGAIRTADATARRDFFGLSVLPLCPGCYMTALFNAAVALAKENGQSLSELGNTMAGEFARLAAGGPDRIEEVCVVQDREGVPAVYPNIGGAQ